jgi:cell division protein FtsL
MLGRSGMNRIIAVLVMLLMGSSWQIISHQHEIRKLNIELEKEKGRYNDLKLEYNRLELQNSKDNATDHVEAIAREKEEVEAAKKAKSTLPKVVTTTSESAKVEPKKEDVKPTTAKVEPKKEDVKPTLPKTEPVKKEVKVEDKSTHKVDVKPASKVEAVKVDTKPVQKAAVKKADPMEDQLGDFLKKQESKSKGN